jgi:hypothetical protein
MQDTTLEMVGDSWLYPLLPVGDGERPMMLHYPLYIDLDGRRVKIIARAEYYTEREKNEQDKHVAALSGPCRTWYASRDEVERMLQR